jgi:ABC-type glutathione transport system ATPase component
MTVPLLELVGIGKTYPLTQRLLPRLLGRRHDHAAMEDVSLSVPRGGVLGLVGESGSGKSTTARIILQMEQPTTGTLRFDGTALTGLSDAALRPYRRRMQMVFQDAGSSLNPRKTVGHLLGESLALVGVKRRHRTEHAVELLRRVGLDGGLLGRYPHQLSGGQRQRMAIARALAVGPDLLVADEPVSSLDVSLQAQILLLLMELRDRLGLTMVFISHDLALVHHLCSSVAVMHAGRIVEQGTPAEVLRNPRHAYTRRLLDAVPRRRTRGEKFKPQEERSDG